MCVYGVTVKFCYFSSNKSDKPLLPICHVTMATEVSKVVHVI